MLADAEPLERAWANFVGLAREEDEVVVVERVDDVVDVARPLRLNRNGTWVSAGDTDAVPVRREDDVAPANVSAFDRLQASPAGKREERLRVTAVRAVLPGDGPALEFGELGCAVRHDAVADAAALLPVVVDIGDRGGDSEEQRVQGLVHAGLLLRRPHPNVLAEQRRVEQLVSVEWNMLVVVRPDDVVGNGGEHPQSDGGVRWTGVEDRLQGEVLHAVPVARHDVGGAVVHERRPHLRRVVFRVRNRVCYTRRGSGRGVAFVCCHAGAMRGTG
ncbi:hypothetical protein NYQ35_10530 [Curtobacterium flaccumfaciens pv. flaccumfaciens]|uniref:hypothetical protein n=1 Tax=Curtobacterium flaccumfaciens TaxID=2035 RepID=UPI00217E5BB6|nr:hypothetical protein [Curtobacterium flaccumfaciens]MCS6569240.1 hypothetical protein [Curtobacterium flaccumfaciens pv. flaccumfaciens]